eukprot:snap_masked-scaffold_15-processed-gene-9.33-mRNA-1 protein AED:0.88 eAED:0.88 QI:0/-1/0/1/-1/1/1/0/1128
MSTAPKHFVRPALIACRQITRRIMRKPLRKEDTSDLMKEVERQIRKEYSEEEWRQLTEDFATWPTEVPSDISDTGNERYIETDTYSTSEDEDGTTAKIRSIAVRVNHLRPKQQMDKKIYALLKSLDKYRVSVFNPYFEGDWAPLTEAEVIKAQKEEMITRTSRIKRLAGKIILPSSLLERQLVHIHLANKHGSFEADLAEAAKFEWKIPAAMERVLRGDTSWKKMVELIRLFRDNCIHCRRLPKAIKTTYSLVTRARRPRETLVADFLYVNRIGHILVLTDAFSRFTQLTHTKTPGTQAVIEALDRFAANYKLERDFTLVTDRGSHFANSLMTALRKELRFSQSFAVSYASWTNGEVEVVNKKVLNFLKSLVNEYRLNEDEWPKILNKIQGAMNELPVPSRKIPGRKNAPTAYELFLYVNPERQYIEPAGLPPIVERIRGGARMLIDIDDDVLYKLSSAFRKRLDDYEKKVAKYVEYQKVLNNKRKRAAVDPALLQYNEGDWCLVSSKGTPRERDKLALEWSGPVQITEVVSKNVYKIKTLDGKATEVHGSRLYFYEPSGFVPSEALRKVYVGNFKHLEVAGFGDVKYDPHLTEYVVEVKWRGFRDEDNTWEPIQTMYEDVRNILTEHLSAKTRRPSQDKLRKRAKQALVTAEHGVDRVIRRVPNFRRWHKYLSGIKTELPEEKYKVVSVKGWTRAEKQEIRKLVLKFGIGRFEKYHLYLPHKSASMIRGYIQQQLGRLDLEEIGGERWDIEKVRKSNEKISSTDFRCIRRFSDCEQALVLSNEEIAKEFAPKYVAELRKHRKRAADYVRAAAELCRKLATYEKMTSMMVVAFEQNKEAEWEANGFRIRYERHEEPTRTPRILTNIPFQIEQDSKWRYLVSYGGKIQLTAVQCAGRIFEILFEESEVVLKCCIAPPEKVWYTLDPYNKEWSQGAPDLPEVQLILADPPWKSAEDIPGGDLNWMNFGIREVRPHYAAVWIPQEKLRSAFQYMDKSDYDPVHSWVWVKMTQRGKIRGALGKIFQRSHEVLYFFKRRGAEGSEELKKREVILADRADFGIKPLTVKKEIRRIMGSDAVLMEVFSSISGLQKGWLHVGTRTDLKENMRSLGVQAVLRQSGVSHLWEEGDVSL